MRLHFQKKVLCAIFLCSALSVFAQTKQRVVVCATGVGVDNERKLNAIIDAFQEALINDTDDLFEVRNGQDEFEKMILDEYELQSTGYIDDSQLVELGKVIGAELVCGIVVEYDDDEKDFYFRAKMISVETQAISKTASFPNEAEGDDKVNEYTRKNLQKAAILLIQRLKFLPIRSQTAFDGRAKKIKADDDAEKAMPEKIDTKALFASLIPGLGLMQKGHKFEGTAYLVGEGLLVGGIVAAQSMRSNYSNKMNNTTDKSRKVYYTDKVNSYTTVRNVCFGSALLVYGLNLWRSYVAELTPKCKKKWSRFVINPTTEKVYRNELEFGVSLTYSF